MVKKGEYIYIVSHPVPKLSCHRHSKGKKSVTRKVLNSLPPLSVFMLGYPPAAKFMGWKSEIISVG